MVKYIYYNGVFTKLPTYIYQTKEGRFEIRKRVGKILQYWGRFATLEEAKLFRAFYIGKKWMVNPVFRDKRKGMQYIKEVKNGYLIHKRINGQDKYFGTFHNLDDAKDERDICMACNWDMNCIVEFGDAIQDKGCVVYG